MPVNRALYVDFTAIGAKGDSGFQSGEGIFGVFASAAAMGHNLCDGMRREKAVKAIGGLRRQRRDFQQIENRNYHKERMFFYGAVGDGDGSA